MVPAGPQPRDPHGPGRPAADHGGLSPKRLIADADFAARAEIAHDYRVPLSEFNDWDTHDRDVEIGRRTHHAECCSECGVHPATWKPALGGHLNAVVAVWKYCRVCELIELAKDAGPPEPGVKGWHLALEHNHHLTDPSRRNT